jgi:hypothetical protein
MSDATSYTINGMFNGFYEDKLKDLLSSKYDYKWIWTDNRLETIVPSITKKDTVKLKEALNLLKPFKDLEEVKKVRKQIAIALKQAEGK